MSTAIRLAPRFERDDRSQYSVCCVWHAGISGCTNIIRPHRGESGKRRAEHKPSECPLTARGGLHRGTIASKPRCRPPRVWAADPAVRTHSSRYSSLARPTPPHLQECNIIKLHKMVFLDNFHKFNYIDI